MDKDRIIGTGKEIKGQVKEAVGRTTGNERLETEGHVDQAEGKTQTTIGKVKDAVRDLLKK